MGKVLKQKNANKYQKWIMLGVCILFYMSFCLVFGVYIAPDSKGYINMVTAREPVYPLFLAFFRKIGSEDNWMRLVIIAQNLIMAVAVWFFTLFLKKQFQFSDKVAYVTIATHFGVAALCQFAAGRASIYTNSILTEGISLSLWIFFFYFLLSALYTKRYEYVAGAVLLGAVMMDIRKQMAIAFIILFAVLLFGFIGEKGYWKRIGIVAAMIVAGVLLAIGGTRLYNYQLRGEFAQNTRDMNLVLTTSLYIADREDAELISDPSVKELFLKTYDILEKKKCNYKYAGEGWRKLEAHYAECYDKITIDTTESLFVEYAEEKGFAPGMDAEQEADRMSSVIVKSLLKDNLFTYARVYFASMGNGFINSVAKRGKVFDYIGLGLYIFYVGLMGLCFAHKNTKKAALFAMAVLIAIAVNVGVTAALIFCQTRYMIYNMALFYTAYVVMCYRLTNN